MTLRHRILTGTTTERDALRFEDMIQKHKIISAMCFFSGVLIGIFLGLVLASL